MNHHWSKKAHLFEFKQAGLSFRCGEIL